MRTTILFSFVVLLLVGCDAGPSLEKYFVAHSEDPNYIVMDVSPDILNVSKESLSAADVSAFESFEKMNMLAFKATNKNKALFGIERDKVDALLKDKKYQQLVRFGTGKEGASLSYVGTNDHIEEFVLFANKKETGFTVIRIMGDDMSPTNVVTMLRLLKKSKVDLAQLKPLEQLMK